MIKSVYGIYKNYNLVKSTTKNEINNKVEEKILTFKNLDGFTNSCRTILVATSNCNEEYEKGRQLTKKIS